MRSAMRSIGPKCRCRIGIGSGLLKFAVPSGHAGVGNTDDQTRIRTAVATTIIGAARLARLGTCNELA